VDIPTLRPLESRREADLARKLWPYDQTRTAMKHFSTLLLLGSALTMQAQITHELHVMDDVFSPADLTVQPGDAIHIIFDDGDHTFSQVDQATWQANEDFPLLPGGYNFGQGTPNPGTDFTITPTTVGTIYYVCQIHVEMGMKGVIHVGGVSGMEEAAAQDAWKLAPNPATDVVRLVGDISTPVVAVMYNAAGQRCGMEKADNAHPVNVGELANGLYTLEVRDMDLRLLSRQRLVVARY
jgi:plastocyanin